jgi:diguanylate cyclase (GGDEF)-like protein
MREFLNNAKIWLVLLIVGMLLVVYLVVYLPMVNNLRSLTVENMHMAAHYKMTILQREINQSVVGSKGISTRSLLKESLYRYRNGELSLDELRTISQSRFTDGIDTLENLKSAFRVSNGKIIATYNNPKPYDEEIPSGNEIIYSIDLQKDELRVISPILSNGQIVGHDIFYYDLGPTISKLDMEGLKGTVVTDEEMTSILSSSSYVDIGDTHVIIEDNSTIYHIESIPGTHEYLFIPAEKKVLFNSVNRMTTTNLLSFFAIGIIFIVASNLITTKLAKERIVALESGREMYRSKYLIDPLTGAYTRRVLLDGKDEKLLTNDISGVAVMMDLTDFKSINDNHGHREGDRVLVKLVETMKDALREEDFVIRYGGDEFLVLLRECDLDEARVIIERIRDSFRLLPQFKYNIDFDFGMEYFNNLSELNSSIEKSDERMYIHKSKN